MKNIRFIPFILFLGALLVSACGAGAAAPTSVPEAAASAKVEAMPVAFVGIVDNMAGDQWVISGTTVTVDASIVRDGPFNVGDRVKVEGHVNPDGSFTVSRVEAPTPQETATLPAVSVDNSNDALINGNTNDANINDDNSNSANVNDDNSNSANSNDDHGNDANINDDNGNASNSNDSNTNDDSSTVNSNDDNGNGSNSNDSNTNDDNGGNTNSNDDHSGSNSNDNSSGGGGGNDNGGDDNGSGGNGNGG